jgi:hypothetical protein
MLTATKMTIIYAFERNVEVLRGPIVRNEIFDITIKCPDVDYCRNNMNAFHWSRAEAAR